jgi:hypothetical protein
LWSKLRVEYYLKRIGVQRRMGCTLSHAHSKAGSISLLR